VIDNAAAFFPIERPRGVSAKGRDGDDALPVG